MKKRRFGYSNGIADVIKELEKKYNWSEKKYTLRVISAWDNIGDKDAIKNTRKIFVKGSILYISIESSSLRLKLQMSSHALLHQLHQKLEDKKITEIRFV